MKMLKTEPVLIAGTYEVTLTSQPSGQPPGLPTEGLGLKLLRGKLQEKKGEKETTNNSYCLVSTYYVPDIEVSIWGDLPHLIP